ncbi:MAG: type II toxin-antitoxin system HicB family antitoxin [Clostridiales bacterium]|jgi:predicted RNase H-like HicB family nuclease|nr:type II toxin-antitoxin system HicB family antitoxin [Eubacteriales bacterium]MDH7566873.1 type II toxin-antitoxin system HicB family antitoxin [Clostridiales bacterium]
MARYVYPAIFQAEVVGGYSVTFPDLLGCCTEGETLEQAIEMARDALGLYLYSLEEEKEPAPMPSKPDQVKTGPGQFVTLIDIDMLTYRQKHDKRAVKKTLTIPAWLNTIAENRNINFSQILQNALIEHLDLKDSQK